MSSGANPLIVILGPTGSGKSQLSLAIARRWDGEIVNCDSVQTYRGFDLGSAKLAPEQREGITHHLLDIAGPGDEMTAGDYSRVARLTLARISARGKLPIVSGGTGFYLRALLLGFSPAPRRHDEYRARLTRIARHRPSSLHFLLRRADALAAKQIHAHDLQKLIRALEIAHLAQEKTSDVQGRPRDPLSGYHILKIGLNPDRSALVNALNRRAATIFEGGLLEETKRLLSEGYARDSKPMQSLGYRQATCVLWGEQSLEKAIEDYRHKTRQYAKRQMTWFRAEPDVNWLHGFGTEPNICQQAITLIADFLARIRDPRAKQGLD